MPILELDLKLRAFFLGPFDDITLDWVTVERVPMEARLPCLRLVVLAAYSPRGGESESLFENRWFEEAPMV